ncbi:triose-phosphate isomerase [Methylophilus medardicus]|uniref:Triosephosphate isomerase n=1 Tax=Methylophilus medardicus TaxID=2588534 RepID=A0A5B8CTY5_9PROT|nr:triose-phosphate isomerase [Methylophilus medardicus]QDC44713.1 triose-phosphate isomerase [Methylophilus medardicus]QDC49720.1 triose-phosphate isomerase [Methylophilus medardicus]QDC53425.1 triose-phosphate isomerase [Methylophilus medardicus]
MRQKLVVGNWKLHGGLVENQGLLNRLKQELHDLDGVETAVCLPYVYLYQAQALLQDSPIAWGAQNVSQFTEGAFTSCISAKMVAEFGCTYTIIGHSERRALKLESNQVATKRLLNALHAGLTPIFCVGETQDERDGDMAELIVRNQMLNVVYGLDDEAFALAKKFKMVIAYEPVWAIGTGEHASPDQAQRMHAFIRMMIAERDREFSEQIRIVYGGSVTTKNAHSLLSMPDIDGGLLGRAALVPEDFVDICRTASRCYQQKAGLQEPSPALPVFEA